VPASGRSILLEAGQGTLMVLLSVLRVPLGWAKPFPLHYSRRPK
jgi:hypothetical protein